ncbi:alpha/beta hydrolase domain-containing protein [Variovorax sp. HJSM1_2]|uniref:alpha/beta hydrolase domain-containing protein n=1 Tax=Variovorax sp. HJSM1_2 TaxID=3366263 RepID=UPI003BDC965C
MLRKKGHQSLLSRFARAAAASLLLSLGTSAFAVIPTPTVTGPIASDLKSANKNYTFFATDLDLKSRGFTEEEFFYSGQANTYDATIAGGIGARPSASATANVLTTGNPYTTRMVVRRPSDPAKFNGTVIVEWMNATSNYDVEALWFRAHEFFLREGYAWVGITAQSGPITNATLGLKQFSPQRYATLDLTAGGKFTSGDPLSYDVYAQGIQALRSTNVLGALRPNLKKVIAAGVSQSAGRVSVYLNAIQTRDVAITDAALLYIGGEKIRTDLGIPVIKLLSETEYVAPASANEINVLQPDTDKIRVWSIAGASHSDWASFAVRYALLRRDQPTAGLRDTCDLPSRSRVPDRHVIAATIDWLTRWSTGGTTVVPPSGPPIKLEADGTTVQRDSRGNVLGGIRVAPFDVPVALDQGGNTGAGTCFLNGRHEPFSTEVLNSLYPTRDAYFNAFSASAAKNVKDGFILQADADDMLAEARVSITGMGLNCGALCANFAQFPIQPSTSLLRDHNKFLYFTGAEYALKSIDAATLSVARGYSTSDAAAKKTQFSQAAKWLQNYQSQVNTSATAGNLTSGQASLFNEYSGILITELQKLGADPQSVALDSSVVETLYPVPKLDSGGGCSMGGRGLFDPVLWGVFLLAIVGLNRRRIWRPQAR